MITVIMVTGWSWSRDDDDDDGMKHSSSPAPWLCSSQERWLQPAPVPWGAHCSGAECRAGVSHPEFFQSPEAEQVCPELCMGQQSLSLSQQAGAGDKQEAGANQLGHQVVRLGTRAARRTLSRMEVKTPNLSWAFKSFLSLIKSNADDLGISVSAFPVSVLLF